jgi:nucleoside-diphosphate-sugar epimerase
MDYKMRILIFGATGWIGSQMVDLFDEASVVTTNTRMESPMAEEVVREVHPPTWCAARV